LIPGSPPVLDSLLHLADLIAVILRAAFCRLSPPVRPLATKWASQIVPACVAGVGNEKYPAMPAILFL